MKKLVQGIVEFRQKKIAGYREKFSSLANGQSPDTLFIACSDSRVVPNTFASTDPGDLFVIRNVGNLIPHCGTDGLSVADESEAAAIEFATLNLNVSDIVICGHSECGAMQAILNGRDSVPAPNLRAWLRHGEPALALTSPNEPTQSEVNRLSQRNVLLQIEHMKTYPVVRERLANKTLRIHGWWFELSTANVYTYEEEIDKFTIINTEAAQRIIERLS